MFYEIAAAEKACQYFDGVVSDGMAVQVVDEKACCGLSLHPVKLRNQFFFRKMVTKRKRKMISGLSTSCTFL